MRKPSGSKKKFKKKKSQSDYQHFKLPLKLLPWEFKEPEADVRQSLNEIMSKKYLVKKGKF